MPIHNQKQATILAEAITTIREDRNHGTSDWHPTAIMNVLRKNHACPAPYPEIFRELIKYADTSPKPVPTFLFDPLRDWRAPGDHTPRDPCESHPTHSAYSCPSCRADVLAGIRPKEFIGKAYEIPMTGVE